MNITELQNRITELEKENEYLKALLDNAGISYNTNSPYEQSSQEIYDENQGRRIRHITLCCTTIYKGSHSARKG